MEKFIEELKNIFGQRLLSVFVYGAKVYGQPNEKDINLMVITDTLSGADIQKCSKSVKNWMKSGNPLPIFMEKAEWLASSDVYAMEYLDIKENNNIIYGEDLIKNIKVKKEDLRFQCEHEAKNLLMRFRGHYFANSKIKDVLIPATKSLIAILKGILRYKNISPSAEKSEVINQVAKLYNADTEFFKKLLCHKEGKCKIKNAELPFIADKMTDELSKLLNYTNNM